MIVCWFVGVAVITALCMRLVVAGAKSIAIVSRRGTSVDSWYCKLCDSWLPVSSVAQRALKEAHLDQHLRQVEAQIEAEERGDEDG